jgi:hypothetical protein
MNGHVFQCFNKCPDKKQFSRTIEALGEYVAKNLKDSGNVSLLIKSLVTPTVTRPVALTPAEENDAVEVAIWAIELKTM